MANLGPALLALFLNCLGFHMFFTPVHFPTSPFVSSIIFTCALYFLIIQQELYPLKYRRIPWFFTRFYEFIASTFLLEFGSSNIWFPMETFTFLTLSNIASSFKRTFPPKSVLFPITGPLTVILQNYTTGIILSYLLSLSALLMILHSTYSIDLGIIRRDGIVEFTKDTIEATKDGIKNIFFSPCMCAIHGDGRAPKRRRRSRRRSSSSYRSN